MVAPTSQKADVRPISFLLSDGRTGELISVGLVIRPEDLSRQQPSRLSVQQTFGGAWGDNFGPGLETINISGHTGWRGGFSGDGVQSFLSLNDTVYSEWHARRENAVKVGQDPDTVKLIFADALDGITNVVAVQSFVLKRNRTRPLLMMYQISMVVLQDTVDTASLAPSSLAGSDLVSAGLDSLSNSIATLQGYQKTISTFLDANIIGPADTFMSAVNSVMTQAQTVVFQADGVVDKQSGQLIGFASDLSHAAANVFRTYQAISSIPDFARFEVSRVANAYANGFCVLRNAFKSASPYPDYSGLYGASTCSSTNGGSPLSEFLNINTFDALTQVSSSNISVSPESQASIAIMRSSDPVLGPLSMSDLISTMNGISGGVNFT